MSHGFACLYSCKSDPASYLSSSDGASAEECLNSIVTISTTSWISLQNGTNAQTKSGVDYTGSNGTWVSNDIDILYDQNDA